MKKVYSARRRARGERGKPDGGVRAAESRWLKADAGGIVRTSARKRKLRKKSYAAVRSGNVARRQVPACGGADRGRTGGRVRPSGRASGGRRSAGAAAFRRASIWRARTSGVTGKNGRWVDKAHRGKRETRQTGATPRPLARSVEEGGGTACYVPGRRRGGAGGAPRVAPPPGRRSTCASSFRPAAPTLS